MDSNKSTRGKPAALLRWAVVGLGHFAQSAVLPAFAVRGAGKLVALVTDDAKKAAALARKYNVDNVVGYEDMAALFAEGEVDVAYIAVPNHRHAELTIAALEAGVHVLCEKPMAPSSKDCKRMQAAASRTQRKLMIAYRLHLEAANMNAVDRLRKKEIGDVRFMNASFCFPIDPNNVRTADENIGGGVLFDIGVYCINAARYFFGEDPVSVTAMSASAPDDERFERIEEQYTVGMQFSEGKLATFVVSFGAAPVDKCVIAGTKGSMELDPAFSQSDAITVTVHPLKGKPRARSFPARDQVAAELVYFNTCVREEREPEPSAEEGLRDVLIIEAILKAARTGRAVQLKPLPDKQRPNGAQVLNLDKRQDDQALVDVSDPMSQSG